MIIKVGEHTFNVPLNKFAIEIDGESQKRTGLYRYTTDSDLSFGVKEEDHFKIQKSFETGLNELVIEFK